MTIHAAQLEQTQYESTGTELMTNGDFSNGSTGWTVTPEGWTHSNGAMNWDYTCLLYTSPSPRDRTRSRMPSSA